MRVLTAVKSIEHSLALRFGYSGAVIDDAPFYLAVAVDDGRRVDGPSRLYMAKRVVDKIGRQHVQLIRVGIDFGP